MDRYEAWLADEGDPGAVEGVVGLDKLIFYF